MVLESAVGVAGAELVQTVVGEGCRVLVQNVVGEGCRELVQNVVCVRVGLLQSAVWVDSEELAGLHNGPHSIAMQDKQKMSLITCCKIVECRTVFDLLMRRVLVKV